MKSLVVYFLGFILLGSFSAQAQNQSDYEMLQMYYNQLEQITNALKTVNSSKEATDLTSSINDFESRFARNKGVINSYIYPQNFDKVVNDMRGNANRLSTILRQVDEQNAKINDLTNKLGASTVEVQKYNASNDSLMKVINNLRADNARLNSTIRGLRDNLAKRDALIKKVVDSLFVAYSNVNFASIKASDVGGKSQIGTSANIIEFINGVVQENLRYVEGKVGLQADDLLRMYGIQKDFERMWATYGRDLSSLYGGGKDAAQVDSEVKIEIANWGRKVQMATVDGMMSAFTANNLRLNAFSDGRSFRTSVSNFVDENVKRTEENATEDDRAIYDRFAKMWYESISTRWAPYLVQTGMLSFKDMADIEAKLKSWDIYTAPKSYTWYIYLAVSLLLIFGLLGMLIKARAAK